MAESVLDSGVHHPCLHVGWRFARGGKCGSGVVESRALADPEQRIPPPISIPFLETCDHLELPPVATYASTVLWNWKPLVASEPIDNLNNIFTLHTLTGSLDEA